MSIITMIGRSRFGGRAVPDDEEGGEEPPPPAAPMVGQWKLNGNATDALGLSNGTLLGTPETGVDPLLNDGGTSIGFDGTDDRMTIPHVAGMLLSSYSIVLWFQADVLPDTDTHWSLINKENSAAGGLSIEYRNDGGTGRIRAFTRTSGGVADYLGGDSGGVGTAAIATGYRVTLCVDENGARLYLGDTKIGTTTNTQGLQSNTAAWSIGAWQGGTTSAFNGVIDEVRLYDGALTEVEITDDLPSSVTITHVEEPPPPTGDLVVNPPIAPQSYSIPGGATIVTAGSGTALQTALGSSTAKDLVLSGTYDKSSRFTMGAAHRLWAQNLGGATLTAGILVDKGPGAQFHGINFNVTNLAKANSSTRRGGALIYISGSATFVTIKDCWFNSNYAIGNAIDAYTLHGHVFQRCIITNFTSNGVQAHDNPNDTTANPRILVTDMNIANIRRDSSHQNGTAEFGIHAGTSMHCLRIKTRNTYWSGIVPSVWNVNSLYQHIDINGTTSAGFYFEHHCWGEQTLEYFRIGGPSGGIVDDNGVNFEAAQDRWGCEITVHDGAIVRHGEITTPKIGMNISTGQGNIKVDDVKFIGQCNGGYAINNYGSVPWTCDGVNYPGATGSVFTNLDVSEMDPGAVTFKFQNSNSISCV